VTSVLGHALTRRAADAIVASDEATVATQIELSEIPAPPFGEKERARRMAELLTDAGLAGVVRDEEGNVVARRPGRAEEPPVVVSAHLDTVFPAGTDPTVRREGDILRGPGISDDARGLATLLALARVLESESVRTRAPLLFAATVGEEGVGDLRGVKHLFADSGLCRNAAGFISLDGAGLDRLVVDGLASRRFRIRAAGPGGHSWVDFGTANPIHGIARLGARLAGLPLSADPKASLTVARTGGGKSINAIPQEAWIEIDTRSGEDRLVEELDRRIRAEVEEVAHAHPGLTWAIEVIGDRPGGRTDRAAPLVRAAIEATRAVGREPLMALSSTDANVPMKLGIPALTMGCGGEAGLAHTTDEWYRNVRGPEGVVRALYTVLLTAGLSEG
jgi:acetylornithine deacetylase/succinyl-diaminopimelate desuccinylase-like protein